jgi:hypothetical protein
VKILLPVALLLISGARSTVSAQAMAPEEVSMASPEVTGPKSAAGRVSSVDGAVIYEREVFQYSAGGRSDPFRSLLLEEEMGVRPEDLSLRGVLIDPVSSRSVAVLSQVGSERRIQLRVGDRIGAIRLLSIQPDRVEIVVEELGVSRRETLMLVRPQQGARP